MEDPCHPNYPQNLKATVGPRNMVHSYATTIVEIGAEKKVYIRLRNPNEQPNACGE
jgi:hypothetical protein